MHAWQDVKVSGEYVRKREITNLVLYCDISQQIPFTAAFQWSITTYDAKVCAWCLVYCSQAVGRSPRTSPAPAEGAQALVGDEGERLHATRRVLRRRRQG